MKHGSHSVMAHLICFALHLQGHECHMGRVHMGMGSGGQGWGTWGSKDSGGIAYGLQ